MILKKGMVVVVAVCAAAALALASCSAGEGSSAATSQGGAYSKISAEEGKGMIDEGGVVLVDVRTPSEYAEAHIPGAINIPNESISSQQPAGLDDLEETLIVYCRSGVRSKEAADKLLSIGYQNVYDMGGVIDWPYDTVSGSEQ